MELFKLVGKIFVNNDEADENIERTGKKADGLFGKLTGGIGKAAKWAAGVTAAATAVGGAMVMAAKGTADAADTIDKASQRMKVSSTSYQELAHAAELSGVSMSTMEKAAKKLEGTGINMDEAMNSLMSITDESERAAAAAEMFGESVAYQMTPLLAAGEDGFQSMKDEAHELGLVMGEDAVKNGAAMNDMFSKVEGAVTQLKNGLMSELMPYAMEILDWVIENLPFITETVQSVMEEVLPIIKPVLDAVMALLPPLMEKVKAILDWLMPYIKPLMTAVQGLIEGILALISGDIGGFIDGIKEMFANFIPVITGLGKDIFTGLWDGIKSIWENISGWVSEKVSWLTDKLMFWRSGNDEMKADGSHAAGLAFVPYDGYRAELHRGETVLNAQNTSVLVDSINKLAQGMGGEQTINVNIGNETLATLIVDTMRREVRMA